MDVRRVGIASEASMAIQFFLPVGALTTSVSVVIRIAGLSQALVGQRIGPTKVATVVSTSFSGMSGSSSADMAACCRAPLREPDTPAPDGVRTP
jgi:TRAP-type C4-dicarboxylate transport system permease large subunit